MENKCKRFLSLLLALVMVIGMMPMGQVRAEESAASTNLAIGATATASTEEDNSLKINSDGNEFALDIGESVNITVDGEYSVDDIDFDANVVAVTTDFVSAISYQLVSAESIESDKEYVIVNMRCYYWNQANYAVLTGEPNGSGLWLSGGIESINADTPLWTIKTCGNGYSMSTTVNGEVKYLNITDGSGGANTVDSAVELNIARSTNDPFWVIYQGSGYLNAYGGVGNHRAGGYGKSDAPTDGGSQWYIYEVVQKPVYTYSNAGEYATSEHTTLEDGQYLFMNVTRRKLMTNLGSDAPNSDATAYALALSGTPEGTIQESQVWTVKNNGAGGYYLMDTRGSYVKFDRHKAVMAQCVSSNAPALEIAPKAENANTWVIGENTTAETDTDDANLKKDYMNCVGVGDAVAGWHGRNSEGNQWKVYSVDATPVGTTTITFTALQPGNTEITIDGTTYYFHVHTWTDATCVTPKTCSVCGATEGDSLTPKNAKPLMVSWLNSKKGVVSLSDCEYKLSGTEGAYSLCNNGVYVNPDAAEGTGIPQQLAPFAGLSLTIDEDGTTQISGTQKKLQVNNIKKKVDLESQNKYHPCWHNFTSQTDYTTDFYLLKENPESTNTDIPGYEIVTQVKDGESYLIAFKNAANEWFVMYPSSTETVALAMIVESTGEFEISYSNISMENDLEMHFAFQQDLVENWDGYYAKIEKKYVEGNTLKTKTVTVAVDTKKTADVDNNGTADHYYVTYDGVAAKEMTDEFYVTICNANGDAVSKVYTDTIKAYAHRVLKSDKYTDAYKDVMVDMLNYGTEAQNLWNYNKEKLANADLSDAQKNAFVGVSLPEKKEAEKTGDFQYKANVDMESNIQFMMAFAGIEKPAKAVVTIDNAKSFETVKFTESAGYYIVTIENTVIADGRLPITCELKNAEGETIVSVNDSIASYAGRAVESNTANANLYKAMMKFSDSAYAYLNPVQAN